MVRFGRGFLPQAWWRRRSILSLLALLSNTFTINGVEKQIQPGWMISETLNERNTMRFSVQSLDGTYRPAARDVVVFWYDGVLLFAGHIHHTDEAGLGGLGVTPIDTACGATDYNALTDRRQVSATLAAGTVKARLQALDEYLTPYGVVLDPAQVNGPSLEEAIADVESLTAILNKASVESGYAKEIDYNKVLRMYEPGSIAAPFNIADDDGQVIGDITVSPSTEDYANYVTVRFTTPAVAAYAFFQITILPVDGETVTVGSTIYTFKDTPVAEHDVQVEVTIAAQIDTLIGEVDPDHAEVEAFEQASDTMKVTAKTAGASGNSIQVSMTFDGGVWYTEGGGEVSHLNLGSDDVLTGVSIAQDVPAQDGGANLFEKVYTHAEVVDQATADALAAGYLVRALVTPREIRYTTQVAGLHPGMSQTIVCTDRNVNGACLITGVDISANGNVLRYDVRATEGLVIPVSHQEKWRQMTGQAA